MINPECDYFEQTIFDGNTNSYYMEIREVNWKAMSDPDFIDRIIFQFPLTEQQISNLLFQFRPQ